MTKTLDALFSEIRAQTKRSGYSLEEVFSDLDPKNVEKLNFHQFRKAITNMDIWIDDASFMAIAKQFSHEQGFVDYKKFLDEYSADSLTKSQNIDNNLLIKFANDLNARGLNLIDTFSEIDKHRTGIVTAQTFKEYVKSTYAEDIANKFSSPPDYTVRYFDIQSKCDQLIKENAKPTEPTREEMTKTATDTMKQNKDIPADALKIMAKSMRVNGIDARARFTAYDKLKTGRLPKDKYDQEVFNYGIPLHPQVIADIGQVFLDANGRFDYITFCDVMEYEQEAVAQQITTETIAQQEKEKPKRPDLETVLNKIRNYVKDRRSQIRGFLENFDPYMTGVIDVNYFLKVLTVEGYPLTNLDLEVLVEAFTKEKDKIDYVKFADAVETKPTPVTDEIEKLVKSFKDYLQQKQIDVRPICNKFDFEKKNVLPYNLLLAVFRHVEFDLNPREQQLLKLKFCDDKGLVSIDIFCDTVNPVIIKYPPKKEEPIKPHLATTIRSEPTDEEKEALARMAAITDKENVDIRNECRTKCDNAFGTMKLSQFDSVMYGIGNVPEKDIALFRKRYEGKSPDEFNFIDFAADVEKYGEEELKKNPSLTITVFTPREAPSDEVLLILKSIKVKLTGTGTDLEDYFLPYDSRMLGSVRKQRAEQIFIACKLELTDEQVQKLTETYEDTRSKEMFEYKRMCIDIANITISDDDLAAMKTVKPQMDNKLANILSIVKHKIFSRRRRPEDMFKGIEEPTVPASDFRMQFSAYGINLREPDMQTLLKAFRSNMRGDIDWKEFCEQVTNIK